MNHRKTRKIQKKQSTTNEYTFHGLHEWTKAMFEKLGWMLLAKRDGHMDKALSYQNGVKRLRDALEEKIKKTREKDRKDDLTILKNNVETLIENIHNFV